MVLATKFFINLYPESRMAVALVFVRVLCATVRDFSAVTMHLNPGNILKQKA
jgi:hypothetical protein